MIVSLVCAIQCAIVPVLLGLASIVPGWAHFGHGWEWISFILIIAAWSLGRGYKKHKNANVLWFAGVGIVFLLLGTIFEEKLSIITESVVFFSGGILLTIAHWKNYQLEKKCSFRKPKLPA